MRDAKNFAAKVNLSLKTYAVRLKRFSCPIIDSDDGFDGTSDFIAVCMAHQCSDCPYKMPMDLIPASEALFTKLIYSLQNPKRHVNENTC